jgi:rubrerythrin
MSSDTAIAPDLSNELALLFQYTVEAYKTFEKMAENLPNPMTAQMFKGFAVDERRHRDLLEMKYLDSSKGMKVTLGNDLRFQDILEGDLSYREVAEMLVVREKTMEKKLLDVSKGAGPNDRNLYAYIAASKRAHLALLERELQLLKTYPDWFRREDSQDLIIHGQSRR